MAGAPEIGNSTSEERRAYIKERYPFMCFVPFSSLTLAIVVHLVKKE
jgi:hypothetical protein